MESSRDLEQRRQMANRLRLALDLFETGLQMMRQRLVRESPGLSDREVDQKLREWLALRPGAEHGDAVGRPGGWPRHPSSQP